MIGPRFQLVCRVTLHLVLALWLGGMTALLAFVISLFKADRPTALTAAPVLFHVFGDAQLVLSLLAIVAAALLKLPRTAKRTLLGTLISAGLIAVVLGWLLTPRMLRMIADGPIRHPGLLPPARLHQPALHRSGDSGAGCDRHAGRPRDRKSKPPGKPPRGLNRLNPKTPARGARPGKMHDRWSASACPSLRVSDFCPLPRIQLRPTRSRYDSSTAPCRCASPCRCLVPFPPWHLLVTPQAAPAAFDDTAPAVGLA